MIEIRRILCPVDFSEFSRHAIDHAVAIARWYGASITAVHVLPTPVSLIPMGDVGIYPPMVFTAEDLEQCRVALQTFLDEESGGTPIVGEIVEGHIVGEIARRAESLPADLIVLGTHGRSGFERLMLGSVTERTLRKVACPVLTVPRRAPDAVPAGPALFTRILCAVDFSPSSAKALAYAASLAGQSRASLTVMHVVELLPSFEPVVMGGPGAAPLDDDLLLRARARVHASIVDTVAGGSVEEVVATGKPYREILEYAQRERADLIVMGAHGGGAGLAAFGSTTSHVVRQAGCPVLSLRA
jgi:nucleotide-binding universal stress UspA family protein